MTQENHLPTQLIQPVALRRRMFIGAGIALVVILSFLLAVHNPRTEWGKLWMIRPLIITPLAGAMGGLFFYLMDKVLNQNGWKKVLTITLGIIGYIIALWLGTVLGLAGTLWH